MSLKMRFNEQSSSLIQLIRDAKRLRIGVLTI
jgi:hypothetical protein